MDSVLFSFGGLNVSAGMVLVAMAGMVVIVVIGFVVALTSLRGDRERVAAAGRAATDNLKENFAKQVEYRDTRIAKLETRLEMAANANADLRAESARLAAQMAEKDRQAEESLKRYENARQQMSEQFKAIAGEILTTNSAAFQKQNREQVDTLLKPLNDKIVEFQAGIVRDRATMNEQIRALAESNLRITTEAQNLTRALKGNAQTQGAWGEMILETILDRSGLKQGEQYRTQKSHAGEDNGRVRTDVEVFMPNGDVLVIDSKVSLTAFEAFTNEEDGEVRMRHLNAHVASIRSHVKTLGDKNYQRHAGSSLDYVMMFIPVEAALSAAVSSDPHLFEFGFSNGVMLTTPTTLMTVLRTVRNVWDIEKRHENAEEIASRAGALYDKVAGFTTTLGVLGANLDRAQKSFSDAQAQLTGRGGVIRQVEMLKDLGAKTSKTLPPGWAADGDGEAAPEIAASDAAKRLL
ncbi:MAG: DNA recombination protein RmuC [Alphaproteobacteria bacterium]|nr:DNA recombination protein RmuC [Alphaproteobacteria bacterium]